MNVETPGTCLARSLWSANRTHVVCFGIFRNTKQRLWRRSSDRWSTGRRTLRRSWGYWAGGSCLLRIAEAEVENDLAVAPFRSWRNDVAERRYFL